jgi:AraC-like DNA-binding protein
MLPRVSGMHLFDRDTVITTLVGVFKNRSNAYSSFDDRLSHGFVYKTEGLSQYSFNDKVVQLEKNELIYLPKHSRYEIRAENGGSYMAVNFDLLSPVQTIEPTKIAFKDHSKIQKLFRQLQDIWVLKNDADVILAKSLIYQMMAEIFRQQEAAYISPAAKEKIAVAIRYLRKHLYDTDLRVSDLYELLGMSDTYFRILFRQVYAMTPIQYMNLERIEQAKSLFLSGDFHTVEKVALAVGYSDQFYFSKVFKEITGKTPTVWKRDQLANK